MPVDAPPAAAPAPDDRFFRQIVDSMRNGVLSVRADGMLAVMNDEAYRIFDLKRRPEDIGRPFRDVLSGHPDAIRVLTGGFELSHLPNRAELRLKASGRVIGYTLAQVRDERGRLAGVSMFFKDLTRVEQLEERERLRDRLAALGEMAAAIAHELKNPLAGIEVMAGLLRRQIPASPDAQSILTDIINEAKLANVIVIEMLEFVRPIRLQVAHASIPAMLHNAVTMAESKARRGDVHVSLQLAPDLPELRGDEHQLVQVFTNLLINAFEALHGEGTITLSARPVAPAAGAAVPIEVRAVRPEVVIEVADDGPGVPADLKDRIFNPFFTTKPQGSGLGLAIVRKIVDAHDGRIDVSTPPAGGTRFRVTLPLSGASEEL
ncbi:MAG TPA: ATP-binding protein [Vicinamibacterales bacterium]|nr:ATP-binding protein [Vicinamibacterales bacterium]